MLKLVSENDSCGLNYIPRMKEPTTEFQERVSDSGLYENELLLFSSSSSVGMDHGSQGGAAVAAVGHQCSAAQRRVRQPRSLLDLPTLWEWLPPI